MSLKEKRTVRIIGERNICLHLSNLNHRERIMRIGKALSSSTRLDILDMLKNTPRSLQEIASILDIPLSSAALHIKTLEEAKLIVTETQPGIRGSMRVCICSMQSFHLETFDAEIDSASKTISLEMPIGSYSNCDVHPTCGLAGENGAIEAYDTVQSFYAPARTSAQLIWFSKGYIEYRFPISATLCFRWAKSPFPWRSVPKRRDSWKTGLRILPFLSMRLRWEPFILPETSARDAAASPRLSGRTEIRNMAF